MLTPNTQAVDEKTLANALKITVWIDPQALKDLKIPKSKKNGHPFTYPDSLMQAMHMLQMQFNLSLRASEGFFRSILDFQDAPIKSPSYTQLYRRVKTSPPENMMKREEVTDIVLDKRGLHLYKKGEWHSLKQPVKIKWNKLYFMTDRETGSILHAEIKDEKTLEYYLRKTIEGMQ
ncbi:MAG: transposase [Candidatus Rhabdochlamydia sp.]